jgi:hypothetical protein
MTKRRQAIGEAWIGIDEDLPSGAHCSAVPTELASLVGHGNARSSKRVIRSASLAKISGRTFSATSRSSLACAVHLTHAARPDQGDDLVRAQIRSRGERHVFQ